MKRISLCIVCLLTFSVISGSLSAQQFKLGFKAGTSIPNLRSSGSNEISQGYESKVAQNIGVIADIGISEKLSIKTGFDFAGQGGIRNGNQPVTDLPAQFAQMLPSGTYLYANFNNEATLNYLELPLMAKMEWGSKLKYYVNAGPYVGFLLNAEQKTGGNSQLFFDKNMTIPLAIQGQPLPAQSFDATTKIEDDLRSTNLGLTGGIGFAYGLNQKSALVFDARAAYGLKSIQKDIAVNGNSKTGGLFLTLGYMFSLN
jgi:hypothetical protein